MRRPILLVAVMIIAVLVASSAAYATHSWNGYHWARTANPFTLKLGDNVSSTWDSYLNTASSDWSQSTVLDTTKVNGGTTPKDCKPTLGRVEVCNYAYGQNGWLGVASIWIYTGTKHIAQGTVKLNDSYFNTSTYNTPAWRNLVSCQEVGHTFGLDHQDENFDNSNLGTCMDYTRDPSTNQHPNQGDYDQLLCIYDPATNHKRLTTDTHHCRGTGHTDSTTSVGANAAGKLPAEANRSFNDLRELGRLVRKNGRYELYERTFSDGSKLVSWVIRDKEDTGSSPQETTGPVSTPTT
jgi:hypothetical protein